MSIRPIDSLQTYSHPDQEFRKKASITEYIPDSVITQIKDKFKVTGLTEEELSLLDNMSQREAVELFSVFPPKELDKVGVVRVQGVTYLAHPKPIQSGGFGSIFKAYDLKMLQTRAFKVPKIPHRENYDALKREAQTHANEQHPNIVRVYDFVEDAQSTIPNLDHNSFMVMEYMDPNESETLRGSTDINPEQAINIVKQVCDAINYLSKKRKRKSRHVAFVPSKDLQEEEISQFHHDINPGNIFIRKDGAVKLSDFGAADTVYKVTGTMVGSPQYMNPESMRGLKVDVRSELFSFTTVIYNKMTNSRYFAPDASEVMQVLNEVAFKNYNKMTQELIDYCDTHGLDKISVHNFFLKAWHKEIDQRFQTTDEYTGAFEEAFTPKSP
ncbi:MAG: serine/threonine protein kinase [Candidatus Pacebacteria bacterium]|nr:serine/threonine protein kinase [Candidatus Paceibacterota bacterium]